VVSKMTLRVHDLPEFFGTANFTVKAASDDAYRGLIREFVSFYREHLFNDHWGEAGSRESREHARDQNGRSRIGR